MQTIGYILLGLAQKCGKDATWSRNAITRAVLTTTVFSFIIAECLLNAVSSRKTASARPLNGLVSDAMPLLGTHLPSAKLRGLKRLYSVVDVFLDDDKKKESIALSKRLQLVGLQSRVYVNKLDPKEIPYDELRSILT
jgi:hypothetical protein